MCTDPGRILWQERVIHRSLEMYRNGGLFLLFKVSRNESKCVIVGDCTLQERCRVVSLALRQSLTLQRCKYVEDDRSRNVGVTYTKLLTSSTAICKENVHVKTSLHAIRTFYDDSYWFGPVRI